MLSSLLNDRKLVAEKWFKLIDQLNDFYGITHERIFVMSSTLEPKTKGGLHLLQFLVFVPYYLKKHDVENSDIYKEMVRYYKVEFDCGTDLKLVYYV